MQLNLATRQSAAYFAFNLCMPCLFVKCKRAVDRVSPEKFPWWIPVRFNIVQWVMVVSLPFITTTFEMWGQSYGLFSVCQAAEERERGSYFGFNPADDPVLEVFPLPLRDAVRTGAAVVHLCLVRPSPRDGSLPLSFLCSSLYYNFELSLCCCSVQRSECPMLC